MLLKSYFKKSNKIAWFRSEYSIYRTEYSQIAFYKDQKIYPQFDKIVCVSKTTSVDFIKYFPNIGNKIIPIHNIQDDILLVVFLFLTIPQIHLWGEVKCIYLEKGKCITQEI